MDRPVRRHPPGTARAGGLTAATQGHHTKITTRTGHQPTIPEPTMDKPQISERQDHHAPEQSTLFTPGKQIKKSQPELLGGFRLSLRRASAYLALRNLVERSNSP
jgi:hypothetical protein